MITDIEDFFTKGCGRCERFDTPDCVTRAWEPALLELRRICREAGLTETVKWAHPCYMHAGPNVVLIGAVRGDVRLNFFNAALMTDPEAVLERQGPNTRHAGTMRFTTDALTPGRRRSYVIHLSSAKTSATRSARIERSREKILCGRGANERFEGSG